MSKFLDDKPLLNPASVTEPTSVLLYIDDNGTGYKVTLEAYTSFIMEGLSCRAFVTSANFNVPAATVTTVLFDTSSRNAYGMFHPDTPGVLTMPYNGMVQARWNVRAIASVSATSYNPLLNEIWFEKNGAIFPGNAACGNAMRLNDNAVRSMGERSQLSAPFSVAVGDELTLKMYASAEVWCVASGQTTAIEVIPLKAWTAGAAAAGGTNDPVGDIDTLDVMPASSTNAQSAVAWVVWNDTDYKVAIADLGKLYGNMLGSLRRWQTTNITETWLWSDTAQFDAGSWFPSGVASADYFRKANDLVTEARFAVYIQEPNYLGFEVNSVWVSSVYDKQSDDQQGWQWVYGSDIYTSLNSGDQFRVRGDAGFTTSQPNGNGVIVIPIRFKL